MLFGFRKRLRAKAAPLSIDKKMPYTSLYKFSQNFDASAEAAYQWCTDYTPSDHALMTQSKASRQITKLSDTTILLTDTFQNAEEIIVKEKLVHLYPDRQMWIATHISGPNKYSQFTYEIVATGEEKSRIDFTAQHLENRDSMTPKEITELSKQLCSYDAEIWKRLAVEMQKDLKH